MERDEGERLQDLSFHLDYLPSSTRIRSRRAGFDRCRMLLQRRQ